MRIAIMGTRGIPNHYGGFEQFAQHLAEYLADRGHEVSVYNSHNHPYRASDWNGVKIVHRFDPEYLVGTIGQFIYDLNCVLNTRKKKFEIILQLGYTSSSVWNFLFPEHSIVVTNMDGLEWRRAKYGPLVKRFLRFAERLAVSRSGYLIADSPAIKNYLRREFDAQSFFIPYGAVCFTMADRSRLMEFDLREYEYDMLIARLEPENNIEMVLDGVVRVAMDRCFVVVGNVKTTYGKYLVDKYNETSRIRFLGSLYDLELLNNLRYYSNLYFHGHSVGGTNPSLLEAMASRALICAHRNEFNAAILGEDGYYFESPEEVANILFTVKKMGEEEQKVENNMLKVKEVYSWPKVNAQYEAFFEAVLKRNVTH